MLSDRDYMGGGRRRVRFSSNNGNGIECVFILIAINAIVFLLQDTPVFPFNELILSFSGLRQFKLWQLVTYMFLHGSFGHILFNMWGLYMFGSVVAPRLGTHRFLTLYFLSGICGGLLFFVFNWNSYVVLLGASGAVFGVTIAAAMLYPDMQLMLLFPPIPMKMKTMAIVFIALEVFFQLSGIQGGVAHLAHLGGVLAAYIFLKILYGKQVWDPLGFIFSSSSGGHGAKTGGAPKGWTLNSYSNSNVSQKELDRILDKISAQGINSLSDEEMQLLRTAREEMKS